MFDFQQSKTMQIIKVQNKTYLYFQGKHIDIITINKSIQMFIKK